MTEQSFANIDLLIDVVVSISDSDAIFSVLDTGVRIPDRHDTFASFFFLCFFAHEYSAVLQRKLVRSTKLTSVRLRLPISTPAELNFRHAVVLSWLKTLG
jgi:hypothetical protein